MKALGLVAIVCYAAHAAWHLSHHRPGDLLWACHLACLLIGVGLLASPSTLARSLVAIGVSWLSFGLPLWAIDLATGGEFIVTSLLTHVVGFAIGLIAIRRLGFPRGTWLRATIAFVALWPITRALTDRRDNVNLAFSIHPGWERIFPSYSLYFTFVVAISALVFRLVEQVLSREARPA